MHDYYILYLFSTYLCTENLNLLKFCLLVLMDMCIEGLKMNWGVERSIMHNSYWNCNTFHFHSWWMLLKSEKAWWVLYNLNFIIVMIQSGELRTIKPLPHTGNLFTGSCCLHNRHVSLVNYQGLLTAKHFLEDFYLSCGDRIILYFRMDISIEI